MPQYSKYTRKENFEDTDLLSGVNERGEFRLFENDGIVDFITQLILKYTSDTSLTKDEADAIKNALDPSEDNVFMTAQDMLLTLQFEDGSFSIPVDTDTQLVIRYTGADDITVTLSNDLIKGKVYTITQAGAGVVTLEGDTDVTVNSLDGLKTPGQGGHIQLWKSGDNLFDTVGGVE